MESDLHAAHTRAAALLDPILTGDISDGQWNSELRQWIATDTPAKP